MAMTEQQQQPVTWPRRWVLIGAAAGVVVVAGLTTLVVLLLAGDDGHEVDEQAWRAAREEQLGRPIEDWPTYRDVWLRQHCQQESLDFTFALALDDGVSAEELRTDLTYACPDRVPELDAFLVTADDPCAGYDAEARERIEEASGVPC